MKADSHSLLIKKTKQVVLLASWLSIVACPKVIAATDLDAVYSTLTNLEQATLGKTFATDLVTTRVERLENKLFGKKQTGSLKARIDGIAMIAPEQPIVTKSQLKEPTVKELPSLATPVKPKQEAPRPTRMRQTQPELVPPLPVPVVLQRPLEDARSSDSKKSSAHPAFQTSQDKPLENSIASSKEDRCDVKIEGNTPGIFSYIGSMEYVGGKALARSAFSCWQIPISIPATTQICIVSFELLPTGKLENIAISQSSQNQALDASALAAVKQVPSVDRSKNDNFDTKDRAMKLVFSLFGQQLVEELAYVRMRSTNDATFKRDPSMELRLSKNWTKEEGKQFVKSTEAAMSREIRHAGLKFKYTSEHKPVEFVLDMKNTGEVKSAKITKSSGLPNLDSEILDLARSAKFEEARGLAPSDIQISLTYSWTQPSKRFAF